MNMNTKKSITETNIQEMSYTDFVGFVNQWNVLPGACVTLSKWAIFSKLNRNSRILELACTSGFSSRELANMTGCSGIGIDISKPSVEMAAYNRIKYAPNAKIEYRHLDAYAFNPKTKFSHVVVGAALKFFPDQKAIIDRITSTYLKNGGYLLASPFYTAKTIPDGLIKKAKTIFGITITTENYKEVMKTYSGFEILFEDRCTILKESEAELDHYCNSTVDRACSIRDISDLVIKDAMYSRLMEIRRMSNELRPYQMYSVLVLRYRSSIYPNRYVELF